MITGLRITCFIFLSAGVGLLLAYISESRIISRTLRQACGQLEEAARARQKGRTSGKKGFTARTVEKLDRLLGYSGIRSRYPFLTPEIYLLIMAGSAALGYFIMVLAEKRLLGIPALFCGPAVLSLYLSIQCRHNYKKTESELLILMNLLDSYSVTASEITGILYRISGYLGEPVRDALEQCYFEAQTTGDITLSLQHLADRIEHPMFKQLIRNLEVSNRYDADFSSVMKSSRRSVQDYLAFRKKRKSISNVAKTEMLMLGLTAVLTFTLMGSILEQSIWEILFHTPAGVGLTVFMASVLLLFYWQVVLFDKD